MTNVANTRKLYDTKIQLGVKFTEKGTPLFQTDGPFEMNIDELKAFIASYEGYDPRNRR
ncbi:hypothetical protein GOZ81_10365 [Agrobacterium vitis]|uniref:hypothetical protein n=1 Tax=Agrobacterium vitis TaxID=373 RepID=UPI0012E8ACFB|nr:hypothetical protein [Agrobacterium vitis]MVA71478.1 hypothetical protein [Agrobacterium vitis]